MLFSLYVNDIHKLTEKNTEITLFADDTNILITGSNKKNVFHDMQLQINKINNWTKRNELTINISKTYYMYYHRHRKKLSSDTQDRETYNLYIEKTSIKEVNHINFLGMQLDNQLRFDEHVNKLIGKLKAYLQVVYKLKDILSTSGKYSLYYAYIYFYFELWDRDLWYCKKTHFK